MAGTADGPYAWTTSSSKINLVNADTDTVTVQALRTPSDGLGAEMITLACGSDGSALTKTVKVTVVQVVFSPSSNQLYGFDDFDTPYNLDDNHICLRSSDHTFVKVDIAGGAVGTDFDFVCDSSDICNPLLPEKTPSFDLRLNGGAIRRERANNPAGQNQVSKHRRHFLATRSSCLQ